MEPSNKAKKEASSPPRNSSITMLLPARPGCLSHPVGLFTDWSGYHSSYTAGSKVDKGPTDLLHTTLRLWTVSRTMMLASESRLSTHTAMHVYHSLRLHFINVMGTACRALSALPPLSILSEPKEHHCRSEGRLTSRAKGLVD